MPTSHLRIGEARRVTLKTIRELLPELRELDDANLRHRTRKYIVTSSTGEKKEHSFDELVEEARETGTVTSLRFTTDVQDPIFGGAYGLGVSEGMTVNSKHLGHEIEVAGPGHTYPIGRELVEDILHYRREICEHSRLAELRVVSRLYRAFTLSCTTLIEAYLNRQVWYFRAIGTVTEEQAAALPLNFEERVAAWLALFTDRSFAALKAVKPCWGHLVELREQRNLFAHAPAPTAALSLKEVHRGLNSARTGIGGTLATLREWQGLRPIGFIERLQHAPEVTFVTAMKPRKAPRH
jgi:hypothetical protein